MIMIYGRIRGGRASLMFGLMSLFSRILRLSDFALHLFSYSYVRYQHIPLINMYSEHSSTIYFVASAISATKWRNRMMIVPSRPPRNWVQIINPGLQTVSCGF